MATTITIRLMFNPLNFYSYALLMFQNEFCRNCKEMYFTLKCIDWYTIFCCWFLYLYVSVYVDFYFSKLTWFCTTSQEVMHLGLRHNHFLHVDLRHPETGSKKYCNPNFSPIARVFHIYTHLDDNLYYTKSLVFSGTDILSFRIFSTWFQLCLK